MNAEEKLNHLSTYLKHRLDIICGNGYDSANSMLTSLTYYYIPSFDDYINRLGTGSDMNIRNMRTAKTRMKQSVDCGYELIPETPIYRYYEYSRINFRSYNFKEVIV